MLGVAKSKWVLNVLRYIMGWRMPYKEGYMQASIIQRELVWNYKVYHCICTATFTNLTVQLLR